MTFEEEFPSIVKELFFRKEFNFEVLNKNNTLMTFTECMELVKRTCLDKQKVQEAIRKHIDNSEERSKLYKELNL